MKPIEVEDQLDRTWIATLLAEGLTTYDIIANYKLTEDVILDSFDLLDKEVLIEGLNFSQDFITKALDLEFISTEDIKNLSMTTYSNLTEDFILKFGEFINWNRMMIYFSTQSDNFEKWVEVIQTNNLWSVISSNDLPIDFIRKWKDNLDWKFLSIVKDFTDEEREEFKDYIVIPKSEDLNYEPVEFIEMSPEELERIIEQINKEFRN